MDVLDWLECPRCGCREEWAIVEQSPIWPSKYEYEYIWTCKNKIRDEETGAVIEECGYRKVEYVDNSPEHDGDENVSE